VKRGDFLLAWPFVTALAVLLINDFILKRWFPGAISGFASDAAGMVFFPVALVALAEGIAGVFPPRAFARTWWFVAATAFVAGGFTLVKLTSWGEAAYETVVTPIDRALGDVIGLGGLGVVQDPWDLLALLLVPLPVWVGWKWRGRRTRDLQGSESDGR